MTADRFGFGTCSALLACTRGATMVQYVTTLGLVALTGGVAFGQFGEAIRHGVRAEVLAAAESKGQQTDGPTGSLAEEVATAGVEALVVQGSWALAAKAGQSGAAAARRKQRGRANGGTVGGEPNGSGHGDRSGDSHSEPHTDPHSDPTRDGPDPKGQETSGSGVCRNGVCTSGEDGSNCFAAGTPVATPLGSTPIEYLAPGDLVLSRDDTTGNFSSQRVSATFVTSNSVLVDVHTTSLSGAQATLRVTPAHLFWTPMDTWVRADELLYGDALADSNGAEVSVVSVEPVPGLATAYNLEVEGTHTYFAGPTSVWVHNGCGLKWPWKKQTPATAATPAVPAEPPPTKKWWPPWKKNPPAPAPAPVAAPVVAPGPPQPLPGAVAGSPFAGSNTSQGGRTTRVIPQPKSSGPARITETTEDVHGRTETVVNITPDDSDAANGYYLSWQENGEQSVALSPEQYTRFATTQLTGCAVRIYTNPDTHEVTITHYNRPTPADLPDGNARSQYNALVAADADNRDVQWVLPDRDYPVAAVLTGRSIDGQWVFDLRPRYGSGS